MRTIFKTALSTAFLATSLSNTSLAKTQGHYLGISAINTEINITKEQYDADSITARAYSNKRDYDKINKFGFGLEYKYAFNYKNFFIAPKISYDYNNIDEYTQNLILTQDKDDESMGYLFNLHTKSKQSYGIGFDIGYDINSKLSIYNIIQIRRLSFSKSRIYDTGSILTDRTKTDLNQGNIYINNFTYGFGIKYQIEPNFDIFANYEISTRHGEKGFKKNYYSPTGYNVARVGISYNFFSDKQSFLRSVLTKKDNTSQVSTSHNNKSFFSKSYDYLKDKKSTTSSFFAKGYNDIKNLITNKKSKNTTLNNQTLNNTELENITTNKKQYKLNNKKKYRQQTIKKRYVKKP